jgi:hypothetical protein
MSDALTFLGGTAVGALVVYLTKDKDTRIAVERFIDGVADSFKALLGRMTPDKSGEATEIATEGTTQTPEEIGTTTKPAAEETVETLEEETKSEGAVSEKKTKVEENAIH